MVFWKGQEAYLSPIVSDAASGRGAQFGSDFKDGVAFQLLSPDHTGPVPE